MPAAPSAAAAKRPPRRVDPRPKHADASSMLMRLINKNPKKVYVGASLADREFGLARYKAMGWKVEPFTGEPGCLQFAHGQTCEPGSPLESMGHVIVSMDAEKHAELEQYGDGGGSGQAGADEVEELIIDKTKGMQDLVRGLGGPNYFRMKNKTTAAREELIGGPEEDTSDPFGD